MAYYKSVEEFSECYANHGKPSMGLPCSGCEPWHNESPNVQCLIGANIELSFLSMIYRVW